MNTVIETTIQEKILLAAQQLESEGQTPFSAEALIVASWQKFPRAFGLRGFAEQYPDSNKVLTSIMGEKGLARKGWLEKVGQKMYSLTREGNLAANRLLAGEEPVAPKPKVEASRAVKLNRDQERYLLSLLDSTAYDKFHSGRKMELTFADACRFWGITENLRADELDSVLAQLRTKVGELERLVGKGSCTLSNGRAIDASDLGQVLDVNAYLQDRFSRHLILLRSRSERG